jgi:hypothetical protein
MMIYKLKKIKAIATASLLAMVFLTSYATAYSQATATSKTAVSESIQRADHIMSVLNIRDAQKSARVKQVLTQHLDTLNKILDERKADMNAATAQAAGNKDMADLLGTAAWNKTTSKLNKLHPRFLGTISKELTLEQVEKVKDAMTENGLSREYNNFLAMFPKMNDVQKAQVKAYLLEARENAMVADSENARKEWFIKFRGRANNFLDAAGFDLRAATDAMQKQKEEKLKTAK